MQIKVYTIDVRVPRWLKRAALLGIIPATVLLGAVHYLRADVPDVQLHSFTDGQVVSALQMNENFINVKNGITNLATQESGLNTRIASLETWASGPRTYSVHVLSNGTIDNKMGDWISTTEKAAADGSYFYHIYYKSGVFSAPPNCTCSVVYQNGSGCNGATVCNVVGVGSGSTTARLEFQVTNILGNPITFLGVCDMNVICQGN